MGSNTQGERRYPPKPADVYLFATCLVDQFAPQAGLDTVRLLEREGIRVHYLEHMALKTRHLQQVANLAGRIRMARIKRPKQGFRLTELVRFILDDVEHHP